MPTGTDSAFPVNLRAVADCALLVEFENRISESINDQVLNLVLQLERNSIPGINEVVPSYRCVLVHYDPLTIDFDSLCESVRPLLGIEKSAARTRKRWQVPVLYGGEAAFDLPQLARQHGLTEDEVIAIHSGTVYRVYMVGFAPGWTFLGGLDPRLHTPRLDTPRPAVPAGCVSIGAQQTLIGSQVMPSGWNLIGQTPEHTFAPEREEPFFMAAGDEVAIRPVGQDEFEELSLKVAAGVRVSREMSPS